MNAFRCSFIACPYKRSNSNQKIEPKGGKEMNIFRIFHPISDRLYLLESDNDSLDKMGFIRAFITFIRVHRIKR